MPRGRPCLRQGSGRQARIMEIRVSLSRWRERVRVRVERSGFPLTSILSPGGERRYLLGYFLSRKKEGERWF